MSEDRPPDELPPVLDLVELRSLAELDPPLVEERSVLPLPKVELDPAEPVVDPPAPKPPPLLDLVEFRSLAELDEPLVEERSVLPPDVAEDPVDEEDPVEEDERSEEELPPSVD